MQDYRGKMLKRLTDDIGVYILCDLDKVPIYVGKTTDGIRSRVRRHLTSARSDVIANRLIDVWEVAYVWAWPQKSLALIDELEARLYYKYHKRNPLMNDTVPKRPTTSIRVAKPQEVQIMPDDEILKRKDPHLRLYRQLESFSELVRHILEVKDTTGTRRALAAHYKRLSTYYNSFMMP